MAAARGLQPQNWVVGVYGQALAFQPAGLLKVWCSMSSAFAFRRLMCSSATYKNSPDARGIKHGDMAQAIVNSCSRAGVLSSLPSSSRQQRGRFPVAAQRSITVGGTSRST